MTGSITRWAAMALLMASGSLGAADKEKPAAPPASPAPPGGAARLTPKVGGFTVSMHASFSPIPKSLQLMDFWFPMPIEDAHQKIYQRVISGPYNVDIVEKEDHTAAIGYMKGAPRGGLPLQVRITFSLERTEDLPSDLSKAADKPVNDEERQIHERWLKPETLIAVDREMKSAASKITGGKKKALDRARAIYDHLVANMTFAAPTELRGAGYGNAKFSVQQMKGDDIDIASAFVGLCRAIGIPARTVIGLKIPEGQKTGDINGYHSWAEFYLDGVGWVPADPAEARRNVQRRSYYFGALDERRLAISVGRDVTLVPPQAGPPLNYWIKPYWEGDQKPMTDAYVDVIFEEVTEIPGKPASPVSHPSTTGAAPPSR